MTHILESFLMKMIYRKFSKTASLPVTCIRFVPIGFLCLNSRKGKGRQQDDF
jgi:hypothetical protein